MEKDKNYTAFKTYIKSLICKVSAFKYCGAKMEINTKIVNHQMTKKCFLS